MISSKRVALVEGQVPGMQISKMLNIPAAPGLSDVLSTNVPLAQVLWPTAYEGLYVLPSGTLDQHHSHSYLDLFNFVLDELCEHFDYVLYDGAAIMTSSEATALANVFDALVLVVQCEKTKWEVVQMAEEKIRKAQGNIIGVILNKRRYYLPKLVYNLISKGVGR
jgi:Mrp family chromosome partitioning ATPase